MMLYITFDVFYLWSFFFFLCLVFIGDFDENEKKIEKKNFNYSGFVWNETFYSIIMNVIF